MTTTSRMSEHSRPSARTVEPRWRIGRRLRRTALVTHIISAGSWIGIDVIVGVLVLVGWFGGDTATRGVAYQALGLFVVWPMFTAGLICLVSGLVLGLGTRWGVLRYWWVAVKLTLNLILCTLILLLLRPGMADVRAYGRDLSAGVPPHGSVSDLFFPPAMSLTALSLAVVLGVTKPWGRISRRRK